MSNLRHILRMQSQHRSQRSMSEHTGLARNTIRKYLEEFRASGLEFSQIEALNDKELEDLFGVPLVQPPSDRLRTLYELFPAISRELPGTGVTRHTLWEEYKKTHPDGYGRSQFNLHLKAWKARASPSMHMEHKFGDKVFVDYTGHKLSLTNK